MGHRNTGRAAGFTLIEMMVTIAIAGILVSIAAPSFTASLARMRLEGVMNELSTDLQFTRSEALRLRSSAALSVGVSGTSYTVIVATQTLKTVSIPSGVTLTPGSSISFDDLRGLSNAALITGSATGTQASLRVGTNGAGRVAMCSPLGAFNGYATC